MGSDSSYLHLPALDGLALFRATPYGQPFPWHAHQTFNISLVEMGTEHIELPAGTVYVPAGHISITHPQEVHANPVASALGLSFRTFYISPALMSYLAGGVAVHFPMRVIADATLYVRLWQLSQAAGLEAAGFVQSFTQTLAELVRRYAAPAKAEKPAAEAGVLQAVVADMTARLHTPAPLADLARHYRMDKSRLLRFFKQHTGLTPHNFVLMKRIDSARQLLEQGSPLVEAALSVGFYDQAHFSRFFKSFVGVSPGQYRASLPLHPPC